MTEEEEEFVAKFTDLSTIAANGLPEENEKSSNSTLTNGHGSGRELPPVPRDTRPPLPLNPPKIIPPRIRVSRPPAEVTRFIPEQEISLPNDGNISKFTIEEMSTFLKHLNTTDRVVNHLRKKNMDGKRFSKLTDSELENLGLKNPIITYFRDKSLKSKKTMSFML